MLIKLVNDSQTQYVQPHLRVCPQGINQAPHFPLENPPLLAPGHAARYTTAQVAGESGDCQTFSTNFMFGLCGWGYGADPANFFDTAQRFGGQIGLQFQCGDTVILHWTDGGADGTGTWTAEVQTAPGNAAPTASFQLL